LFCYFGGPFHRFATSKTHGKRQIPRRLDEMFASR